MERNSNCRALENKREVETGNIFRYIREEFERMPFFVYEEILSVYLCTSSTVFTHKLEDLLSS